MQLSAKMDSGPIFDQQSIDINNSITKQELANILIEVGKNMLIKNLPSILNGSKKPISQNDDLATYDRLIQKSDGQIITTKPASILEKEVRAYAEWPRSRILLNNIDVILTTVKTSTRQLEIGKIEITDDNKIFIGTPDGSLEILGLIPIGKKQMSVSDFIRGYKDKIIS
jgi:methionyl-tRNA formyltransferase